MSDKEKLELAQVFATVLDSRMKALYTEIAHGFVEISNGMMEDLAMILEKQGDSAMEALLRKREQENPGKSWADKMFSSGG